MAHSVQTGNDQSNKDLPPQEENAKRRGSLCHRITIFQGRCNVSLPLPLTFPPHGYPPMPVGDRLHAGEGMTACCMSSLGEMGRGLFASM